MPRYVSRQPLTVSSLVSLRIGPFGNRSAVLAGRSILRQFSSLHESRRLRPGVNWNGQGLDDPGRRGPTSGRGIGSMMTKSRKPLALWWLTLLGTAYFVAGKFGLSLAFVNASASPVWPPSGIAFAAFLLLGSRAWPAILVGAFLVNVTTAGSVATSIGIAVGNTLEGRLGADLVRLFANGRNVFDRSRDVFKFVLLAALFSTTVSATIGVTSLTLAGYAHWREYSSI